MNELTALLTEVADEAKVYGSTEQAIHLVRRRRRLTRIVPLVAAAAVVLALVAVSVPLLRGSVDEQITSSVSWLPKRLSPAKNPPLLPADHAVGEASLVYTPKGANPDDPTPDVLVTTDGTQYRLPGGPNSISPDGRWLLSDGNEGLRLRDLTSIDTRAIEGRADGGLVWAPDSSRLAVAPSRDVCVDKPVDPDCHDGSDTVVVDLRTGDHHTVPTKRFGLGRVCGLLHTGDLVVCGSADHQPQFWVLDARTGATRSHVTPALGAALTDSERRAEEAGRSIAWQGMLADGSALIAQTYEYVPEHKLSGWPAADLILIDISTGRMTRRFDLPLSIGKPIDGGRYTEPESWPVRAGLPEGLLVAHLGPLGNSDDPGPTWRVLSLELLDLGTGQRGVTTRIGAGVTFVNVRGTGW